MKIEIIGYQPCYAADFERLNVAWLEKFFVVEPYDAEVLGNPQRYILDKKGEILLAQCDGVVVGAVALMHHGGGAVEITKMAVDEGYQGQGIGKMLMQAAIDTARAMQPAKIFLLTNSKLGAANALYEKFGFVNTPLEPTDQQLYARCDRRWVLPN